MFGFFIWGNPPVPELALQEAWGDKGSLGLPDLFKYYLAGQGVFAQRWLLREDMDSAMIFEAAAMGSSESMCLLVYRGSVFADGHNASHC